MALLLLLLLLMLEMMLVKVKVDEEVRVLDFWTKCLALLATKRWDVDDRGGEAYETRQAIPVVSMR